MQVTKDTNWGVVCLLISADGQPVSSLIVKNLKYVNMETSEVQKVVPYVF